MPNFSLIQEREAAERKRKNEKKKKLKEKKKVDHRPVVHVLQGFCTSWVKQVHLSASAITLFGGCKSGREQRRSANC